MADPSESNPRSARAIPSRSRSSFAPSWSRSATSSRRAPTMPPLSTTLAPRQSGSGRASSTEGGGDPAAQTAASAPPGRQSVKAKSVGEERARRKTGRGFGARQILRGRKGESLPSPFPPPSGLCSRGGSRLDASALYIQLFYHALASFSKSEVFELRPCDRPCAHAVE